MALSDVPRALAAASAEAVASEDRRRASATLERLDDVDPSTLHVSRDRAVIDRIAKIIETDAALEQDELFRLRRDRTTQPSAVELEREKQLEARQTLLNRSALHVHPAPGGTARRAGRRRRSNTSTRTRCASTTLDRAVRLRAAAAQATASSCTTGSPIASAASSTPARAPTTAA